jgi:cysteinyl-tRNA synthetase
LIVDDSATDLESRVATRKRELIEEMVEHKKKSSRAAATEAIDAIRDRLAALAHIVKDVKVGAALGDGPRLRLAEWIAR